MIYGQNIIYFSYIYFFSNLISIFVYIYKGHFNIFFLLSINAMGIKNKHNKGGNHNILLISLFFRKRFFLTTKINFHNFEFSI
jgi:hypothetical protein